MSPHRRCVRAAVAATFWWITADAALSACPVCFRFDDPSAAAGAEAAVFVLGGVTVSVLIPCALFAVRLARRSGASRTDGPESHS